MAAPCCRAAALGAGTSCRLATKELSGTPIKSGSGGKQSFPSSSRILRSADFRTVYDNGTRVSGPLFAAFCLRRREDDGAGVRIGLTVPKALGGAVVRNRIKRRLRSAFRLHRADWNLDWDIVLNPRKAAILAPFADLERALAEVIRKCRHL
jgi:ribonuclease P protein component